MDVPSPRHPDRSEPAGGSRTRTTGAPQRNDRLNLHPRPRPQCRTSKSQLGGYARSRLRLIDTSHDDRACAEHLRPRQRVALGNCRRSIRLRGPGSDLREPLSIAHGHPERQEVRTAHQPESRRSAWRDCSLIRGSYTPLLAAGQHSGYPDLAGLAACSAIQTWKRLVSAVDIGNCRLGDVRSGLVHGLWPTPA